MEHTRMQLDHINISTPGELMETVREFYCEALGFRVGDRPDIPIAGYWLYPDSGGGASVHLIESNQHNPPASNYLDHVAFRVESLDSAQAHLDARGIEYEEIKLPEMGIHQLVLTDPAGTRLELNSGRP